MGRQHVRDGRIHVVQKKTRKSLAIPIHPNLQAIIDATPSDHLTFIVSDWGKPFASAQSLSFRMRTWVHEADLKGCPPAWIAKGIMQAVSGGRLYGSPDRGNIGPQIDFRSPAIFQCRRSGQVGRRGHSTNTYYPHRASHYPPEKKGLKSQLLTLGLVFTMEARCYREAVACNGRGSHVQRGSAQTFALPRRRFRT